MIATSITSSPASVWRSSTGATSIVKRGDEIDRWLAIPFGVGAALTIDEAALLVELEDVYWSKEGILSVQATLGAMTLLGALVVGGRLARRGEAEVLDGHWQSPARPLASRPSD